MSAFEYRVRWRREGGSRATTRIFQTKKAAKRLILILEGRLAEAFPDTDPSDFACCNGNGGDPFMDSGPCPCKGQTYAEQWAERHEQFPPIIEGPAFETREVGGWRATRISPDREAANA